MENPKALQSEALQIIDDLGLIVALSQYGEARIVGSVALNLVVKRDIDIHLVLERVDLMDAVYKITRLLLDEEHIQEIRISDYRERDSIKIGIDAFPGFSGQWSVDIWITTDAATTGFAQTDRLIAELLPEHRTLILDIKHELHQQNILRDGMSSLIYKAVVDDNVGSAAEFHRYIEKQTSIPRGVRT